MATGFSNLVVYEPLGGSPGAFRIVYAHDYFEQFLGATFGRSGIAGTAVTPVSFTSATPAWTPAVIVGG